MNLWVDDAKKAPDETWATAKDFIAAYHLLRQFYYDTVALDHDLGDGPTGYDLLVAMERGEIHWPRRLRIISWNPVGVKRMKVVAARLGIPFTVDIEGIPVVGVAPKEGT